MKVHGNDRHISIGLLCRLSLCSLSIEKNNFEFEVCGTQFNAVLRCHIMSYRSVPTHYRTSCNASWLPSIPPSPGRTHQPTKKGSAHSLSILPKQRRRRQHERCSSDSRLCSFQDAAYNAQSSFPLLLAACFRQLLLLLLCRCCLLTTAHFDTCGHMCDPNHKNCLMLEIFP